MEFLMTYGWAILVVLVAIGALAYFGVLNPSRFLPASCTLVPGLACSDFQANNDGGTAGVDEVVLIIQNGMGKDFTTFTVTVGAPCTSAAEPAAGGGLMDGEAETFTIDCAAATAFGAGERLKADVTINYQETNGLAHVGTGQVVVEAQ